MNSLNKTSKISTIFLNFFLSVLLSLLGIHSAFAAHGYALWNDLKYPENFAHFDYVNPNAPKGGELRLISIFRNSTFDKYNPFTIKGSAPAYLSNLMFDSLLISSLDETGSAYGLLAKDIQISADGLSAVFELRPEARFHNGSPVLAKDVKHSFDTLLSAFTSPAYKTMLEDVKSLEIINDHSVRYRFKKPNRELPLMVGSLPVFSHEWGAGKPFDQVIMDEPIGSGPYKIGFVRFGKDITYVLNPNYWARDLNVRKGTANFERITVKIYKDSTSQLEALKAGEFDLMRFFSAGDWARRVNGKRFDSGELVKGDFTHRQPSGFQSFVLNTRKKPLDDIRVREALGLAFDFEWMNKQLFYSAYQRVQGLFGNTDCSTTDLKSLSDNEIMLLKPWQNSAFVPPIVWKEPYKAPRTDSENGLRNNLKRALALLKEAGWEVAKDGLLRNTKSAEHEAMVLEYLDSAENKVKTYASWVRNLEKIGITLNMRTVDYALYQERLQKFDFEIISIAFGSSHNPGQEYADLFGSQSADLQDSGNFAGVKNPAVDSLIQAMISAKTKPTFLAACRALDRVISHNHYLIPQYASSTHRMVYNQRLLDGIFPMPPYSTGEFWIMDTWWAKPVNQ